MARPPKPGKCVHCLKHADERNWDHVFPESWYQKSTPLNLAKWQIPSCIPCNRRLGKIESDFLLKVSMCLDPHDPASSDIVAKALRSLKPQFARTASDVRAREALAKRFTSGILQGDQIPAEGHYPNLGERWGRSPGSGMAVPIPVESFQAITEKIVRGLEYYEHKRFIDPPYGVKFFALTDQSAEPVRARLDEHGEEFAREPGIIVRRLLEPVDRVTALYELRFWKQFTTFAAVESDANLAFQRTAFGSR